MVNFFSSLPHGGRCLGMALGLFSLSVFSQTATVLPDIEVRALPASSSGLGVGVGSPQTQLFTGQDWMNQPLSGQVINQADMALMGPGRLTDLLRLDSSVEPYYSPLGYYEGFLIRGFAVDPVLGIRVNGVPVVGESRLNMQNKQQVQTLRGPAGAWAGAGTSAGLINLVTERPRDGRELYLTAESRASLGAGIDLGQTGPHGGWRLNAAIDHLRPEARGADGGSGMVSLAFDRPLGSRSVLEMDLEYSRHSQRSQPGSQLLGGTVLPPLNPKLVLGGSSWSKPVVFDSLFAMGRITHAVDSDFKLIGTASLHRVKTDDRSSFPYGCGIAYGTPLGTYFCADGSFDLYDYRSLNEQRDAAYLALDGLYQLHTAGLVHELAFGVSYLRRTTEMPEYSYLPASGAAVGNVFTSSWGGGPSNPSFAPFLDQVITQSGLVVHDRITLSSGDQFSLGARWIQHEDSSKSPPCSFAQCLKRQSAVLPTLSYSHELGSGRAFVSYRQDLEAGQRAPLSSANHGEILSARRIHSSELGLRLQPKKTLGYEATLFYSERPYNFRLDAGLNDPWGEFVQQGKESRLGLELGARGALGQSLTGRLGLTAMQAKVSGTSQDAVNGNHALNTPKLRMNGLLAYKLPALQATQASVVWNYVGRRPATADGRVELPSYHRFDLGLLHERRLGEGTGLSLRFYVENVFDHAYWRDAADFLGDGYLTAGAPRTFKASLTLSQ
jgi:iron complex outermembrane receptor protein